MTEGRQSACRMKWRHTSPERLLAGANLCENNKHECLLIMKTTIISAVLTVSLLLTGCGKKADRPGRVADPWASRRDWKVTSVKETTLEVRGWRTLIHRGNWRNLPFQLSQEEQADVRTCVQIAQGFRSLHNGNSAFMDDKTRRRLEELIQARPGFFYAEFLLATWHQENGEPSKASDLFEKSYQHAPVVLLERFEFTDGRPLPGTRIQTFAIECNRVRNASLDPSLNLFYPLLATDEAGWIRLPAYDTVFRIDDIAYPSGYDASIPRLGWFFSPSKVGLLPPIIVRSNEAASGLLGGAQRRIGEIR